MILKVAELLLQVCRKTDMVVRLGGDEFVVLCPASGYDQTQKLVDRIREHEAQTELECSRENGHVEMIPIRMSIGVASSEDTPPETVMKKADHRMYLDKEAYYVAHPRYR